MSDEGFPQLLPVRRTGGEEFRDGMAPLGFNLLGFWQWGASDLISNTFRGRFAEFLVAKALLLPDSARNEWDSVDLRDGERSIEVKSSSYLQSWYHKALSKPCFRIGATRAWDPATNVMAAESRRQSDLYVFALLAHRDQTTLDPRSCLFYARSANGPRGFSAGAWDARDVEGSERGRFGS